MKNLIITLTLLLGVMSYGQGSPEGAYVIEYDNEVFTHRRTGNTDVNACLNGVERHYYLVSFYSNPLGDDILVYRPAVSDRDNRTVYHWVSDADRDAFRVDLADGRDETTGNTGYLERYYNRDGSLSLTGPAGCPGYSITPDAYFRSQPDFTELFGEYYLFRDATDIAIVINSNGNFFIDFVGTDRTDTYSTPEAAYERIQYLLDLTRFERELIADGFRPSPDSVYDWEKRCETGVTIRIDVVGDGTYQVQSHGVRTQNQSIEDVRRTLEEFCTVYTPQGYLESRNNYDEDRSRGSTYFFGDATNTYISIVSDSSFRVAIGTLPYLVFESYTSINDAYARLQDLLDLRSWERELIGLGFTLESQSPNVWVKDCNGRVSVRPRGTDRLSISGVPNTGFIDIAVGLTRIANHCGS